MTEMQAEIAWKGVGRRALTRAFALTRALLMLAGLVVLALVAHPASRDRVFQWSAPPTQIALEDQGAALEPALGGAGEPPAALVWERGVVAEHLSRRYRVAEAALDAYVASAYRAGREFGVDPLLILAIAAVESKFNPVAESAFGALGLMQVIPRFHRDKLAKHGGAAALLDPDINIRVGAQILSGFLRRNEALESALQTYAGASDEIGVQYAARVLAERTRLEQALTRARRA